MIVLLISIVLKVKIIIIIFLTIISFVLAYLLFNKQVIKGFKVVKKKDLPKQNTGIVVGEDSKKITFVNESKVLIIDKIEPTDYLNTNIRILSSFGNKPSFIIEDENAQLYYSNFDLLKKQKYEIIQINLNNIFIDVFKIISNKMYAVKDLELEVSSSKGQYITGDETYNAYEEIRKKIRLLKKEIKDLVSEFIICYYKVSLNNAEFILLSSLIFLLLDNHIYRNKIVEINAEEVFKNLLGNEFLSITKIKRNLSCFVDSDFIDKEEVKKIMGRNSNFNDLLNKVIEKTKLLLKEYKEKKIIYLDSFYSSNEAIFINGENKELLKLFLFLINYAHVENDLYLLLNSNVFYEFTLKKLKVIQVMNELTEVVGLDNYSVKVYRGINDITNKKEVLRLCKKELDEVSDNQYEKVFELLRLFDKLDINKNEVLVINPRNGNVIINLEKNKLIDNLSLKYSKKN